MNTSPWNPRAKFACGVLAGVAMYAAPARATVLVPDVARLNDARFNQTIVAQRVLVREHNLGSGTTPVDDRTHKTTLSPLASNSAEEWSAIACDQLALLASELETPNGSLSAGPDFDDAVFALGRVARGRTIAKSRMGIPATTESPIDATESEELADLRSTATRHGGTMLAVVGFGR